MLANLWETRTAFEDWNIENKLGDLGVTSVRQRIVCLTQRSRAGMGRAFAAPQSSCRNQEGDLSQSARCCSQGPQDPRGFMPATAACSKVVTPEARNLPLSPGCCRQSAGARFEADLLVPSVVCV